MKERLKPHLYRMLSFLIPCVIMLLVFALNGKYPFGQDALLESDAAAQYYPFLLLLRRTVRSGGSLLYTWRAGFGTNFWALIAYYCLNPWNLIAVMLPESLVQGFLSLTVPVRIGLAGLSAAILMQTLSKKQCPAIPVFASLYGLSLWFIWNYFQLIWLDAAALMPLQTVHHGAGALADLQSVFQLYHLPDDIFLLDLCAGDSEKAAAGYPERSGQILQCGAAFRRHCCGHIAAACVCRADDRFRGAGDA